MVKGKNSHFVGIAEEDAADRESEVEFSLASEDEKAILAELDKLDLDENSALEIFVSLEKEKRTWKENKKLKLAQRKDRRHFSDKSSRPYPYKSHQGQEGLQCGRHQEGFSMQQLWRMSETLQVQGREARARATVRGRKEADGFRVPGSQRYRVL